MSDESEESFKQLWQDSDRARHPANRPTDLGSLVQTLIQRNFELTTLVTTLVDMLAESGTVDPNVLLAKVDGQLEMEAPKPDPAAAAKPKGPMTHCARCAKEIPMAQAEMTGNGLMCAHCALGA
jgi:hypothetical protein